MRVKPPTLLTRLANRLSEMDGKSETVKQLAKVFDCPYSSLYIPIRQLEDVGFLKLKRGKGVIIYGARPVLSSEAEVQVSDTTKLLNEQNAGEQTETI